MRGGQPDVDQKLSTRRLTAWRWSAPNQSATVDRRAVDRSNACDQAEFDIVVTEHPSGTIVGTADLHAVNTMTASTSQARWAATSYLWLSSFTGVGAPAFAEGSLFGSYSTVGASCLSSGGTWTAPGDGESRRGTGNVDVTGLSPGKVADNVGGSWEYTLGGDGWRNEVLLESHLALSRCDNATAGTSMPGCVFANIPGVLAFSQTAAPAFVQHVYQAQLSGLKGRLGTGTYPTRLTDGTLSDKNGAKACPRAMPRPADKSCDEHPFRSTYEGAYTSGATAARSFPGCGMPDPQRKGSSGWSRCFVPDIQNSSGGGSTSYFYKSQRMLDRDAFEIGHLP